MANEGQLKQWNNPRFIEFWKGVEPNVAPLLEPLMETLKPQAGEHILDVGCGGALTTLTAASRVAPGGSATGVDISEPLLELASQRAKEAGIENARFVRADAQVADIPGAPFDAVISRLGVMFFGDPPAAFANIRRHLKPGARMAAIVFQSPPANPWYPLPILAKYAPPRPPSNYPPPSPFALGDQAQFTEILTLAGFEDIGFSPFTYSWDEPEDQNYGPGLISQFQLEPEQREAAIAELNAHQQSILTNGRDRQPRNLWVVQARNP